MPIAERFVSINGEGLRAGQLSAFIRFAGCSLACSYCDTAWARDPFAGSEQLSVEELVDWAFSRPVRNITLTGGEPLEQPLLPQLVERLVACPERALAIEIETNGACDISALAALRQQLHDRVDGQSSVGFTLDWKMPSSGMADAMLPSNIEALRRWPSAADSLKFVCGTEEDLLFAMDLLDEAGPLPCAVLLSPVAGALDPAAIAAFMAEHAAHSETLRGARLQLQLHKILWPGQEKGV